MKKRGYLLVMILLLGTAYPLVVVKGMEQPITSKRSTASRDYASQKLDSAANSLTQERNQPNTSKSEGETDQTEATIATAEAETTETTASKTTASKTESSAEEKEKVSQKRANSAAESVATWAELETALLDENVTAIQVSGNLTATKMLTISRAVTIDFQNAQIDLKGYSLKVTSQEAITLANVMFTGTAAGSLLSGNGQANLVGTITAASNNLSYLANMSGGSLRIDGAVVNFQRGTNATAGIVVKNLTITNQAEVTSSSKRFYAISTAADAGAEVVIEKGSKVKNQSMHGGTDGQVWDITRQATITIKDPNTEVEITGNHTGVAENGGLFLIDADNSTLNLIDGAQMTIHSTYASAILLQSKGGSFNVRNQSQLHLIQDSSGTYTLGATLRFRLKGNMTFNVENQSKIEIEKNGGSAPAIRMYGGSNLVNVAGGSDFIVKNQGTGKASNPGIDGGNQGILYTAGGDNNFSLKDENSNVSIDAQNGAAIDSGAYSNTVTAASGTYFIARGKTASASYGIFNAGTLSFQMDSLKYFDFQNSNKGKIFDANSASTFSSTNSDVQVWNTAADIEGDPTYAWYQADYSLKGTDLNTLVTSTNSDLAAKWGATKNYSRMTANNQSARIDDLRIPTDADKKIVAHAVVPEGKGELRDAYTDEVQLTFGIYDETGKEQFQVKGESEGELLSVYGEEAQKGNIVANMPNDQFIKRAWQVRTLSGASGKNGDSWVHSIAADDLFPDLVTTYDVTPPSPAKLELENDEISPHLTEISGTGEPNAKVMLYLNGEPTTQETTIATDGTFTLGLPEAKTKGDVLQLVLQDTAGKAAVLQPPTTNSAAGNAQPLIIQTYHDAEFLAATKVIVVGTLELSSVPTTLDFGQQTVSTQTETILPVVSGKLVVSDTRGTQKKPWRLVVKESTALTNGAFTLTDVMYYQTSEKKIAINAANAVVESDQFTEDQAVNISEKWNKKYGLVLELPVEKQRVGEYKGTLTWALEDVPENN